MCTRNWAEIWFSIFFYILLSFMAWNDSQIYWSDFDDITMVVKNKGTYLKNQIKPDFAKILLCNRFLHTCQKRDYDWKRPCLESKSKWHYIFIYFLLNISFIFRWNKRVFDTKVNFYVIYRCCIKLMKNLVYKLKACW